MNRLKNIFSKNNITKLKYGLNPVDSNAYFVNNKRNIKIFNGKPSYINILDALYSYNLVLDLKKDLNKIAASSFKHNSPAGVAFSDNIFDSVYQARNCDSLSSYGDFISVNDKIDEETALYLKNQVSDGIIASDYSTDALKILKEKKKGNYIVLKADFTDSFDKDIQYRKLFDTELCQIRKNVFLDDNIKHKYLDSLKLGFNTAKYTQSNTIVIVYENNAVGISAGQQNRVQSVEIAGNKLNNWIKKYGMEEQIDYDKLILVSDSFFPFKDNIDIAKKYNIKTIVSQEGSIRDKEVIDYAKKLDIEFITFKDRLFLH